MCVCVCVSPPPLAVARGVRGSQSLPTIAPYLALAWLGRSQSLTLSLTPLRFAVARLGVLAGRSRSHAIPSFSCLVLTVASSASPNRPLSYAVSVEGGLPQSLQPPSLCLVGFAVAVAPSTLYYFGVCVDLLDDKSPSVKGLCLGRLILYFL